MKAEISPDPAVIGDRRRIREARREAQRQVSAIEAVRQAALLEAFRAELSATVRSVSPFLEALLKSEGLSIDQVVSGMKPVPGWPRRPRLSRGGIVGCEVDRHMYRYYLAASLTKGRQQHPYRDSTHGLTLLLSSGAEARVQILGHSLEVELDMDAVRFETRFGILRIELGEPLPETIAAGIVGRPIDAVIDNPVLRGSSWVISAVEEAAYPFVGQVLVINSGNSPYCLPWVRAKKTVSATRPETER